MLKKLWAALLTLALIVTTLNYIPQTANASQSDAENYDWAAEEFLGVASNVPEYDKYFQKYKMVLVNGAGNVDIIQAPGGDLGDDPGVYVTFPDANFGEIAINDVSTKDYNQQGAGLLFHMSMFEPGGNDLVVKNQDGSIKAEFYVYNYNNGEPTTPPETSTNPGAEPKPGEPGSSALPAPTAVEAYNFYAQEKGYQIIFTETEGAVSYNVYLDNETNPIANVEASDEYIPADALASKADGQLHTIYVAAVDGEGNVTVKSEGAGVRVTTQTNSASDPTDISRIYVVTNAGAKGGDDITKENKTAASLTIISSEGAVSTVSQKGTIKLRGNSTALADKPAYNISFDKKQQVFTNAAKGKKWCLLANAFEKTLMRNKLAMDFGRELGNIAAPEEHYADLYIDGEFKGSYVISEPADNERAGMTFDDSPESDNILFEMESQREEAEKVYYTTPRLNVRFTVEDPEDIDISSAKYASWVQNLQTFENALINTASDDVFQYMNVDSFVDMYIVNELFNTVDFGYSSVKFYITDDENGNPIINAGPLWDFDLSAGNSGDPTCRIYDKFRGQEVNTWFQYLMQNQTFKSKVIAKFEQMQPRIQNMYKDNKLGKSQITQIDELIHASRVRNYTPIAQGGAGWSENQPDSAEIIHYRYSYIQDAPFNTYTYDQHVQYLTDWLKNKNEWMCTQWGIDYTAYDSEYNENVSADLDVTGYQMSTNYNNIDGNMGIRVIYQAEPLVNGQQVSEVGVVYGLVYGDTPITEDDVVYGSDSEYVKSYPATNEGKLNVVMGDSETATYYVRTMGLTGDDGTETPAKNAYTTKYFVRTYAKLNDGSVVYSNVTSYTVFKVADVLYQKNLVSTKSAYDHLYNKILKYVNSDYREGDFNWSGTLVK